jgi:CBS-domain-containing membrane protein
MDKRSDTKITIKCHLTFFVANIVSVLAYCAQQYVAKLSAPMSPPIKISKRKLLLPSTASLAGSALGIVSMGFIASHFSFPLLLAPFGASAVLLFSIYDSPLAQPRSAVFGHALSALIGSAIALTHITYFWNAGYISMALSVAVSIFVMQMLRITHPPAGATAFIASAAVTTIPSFISFTTAVAVGSLVLVMIAIAFNNVVPGRKYPIYW